MIYLAYGLDMGKDEMLAKVPNAEFIKAGKLDGYSLNFRGLPEYHIGTIEPAMRESVPVSLWEIDPDDLKILDRHKGVPALSHRVTMEYENVEVISHCVNGDLAIQEPSQEILARLKEIYSKT